MRSPILFCLFISFCVLFCWVSAENGFLDYASVKGKPYRVDYDKRAIKINGQRTLFLSGSVHPPRVSVGSWDGILKQAKANGLNMIQVYVFWNYHEPLEGTFTWEGNADLHKFIELCAENNLFVNLRIGPYVCAEWNYGGIPAWLGFKQGVQFRTYNQIWMDYMAAWMKLVINKTADLFASNGGPIVLAQIENEYDSGGDAQNLKYVSWCGELVEQFNTTIPWVMCNGDSAKNTINTCNDLDCTNFITSHGQSGRILIDQPALWTEAEGGFQVWGASPSNPTSYFWGRSAEDMSFSVAKWFARGGSHLNYYMYYGGNHYGPWNGNGIVTMYASDVNICPDGLPHEPKYSHLGKLHQLLAQYADVLVSNDAQLSNPIHLLWYDQSTHSFKNGTQQIAFAYEGSSKSLIFVENQAGIQILTQYKGVNLTVEPYSVTLLDEQFNVLFSTGKVEPAKTHRVTKPWVTSFDWKAWKEPLADSDTSRFPHFDTPTPREQLNATYTVFRSDPVLSQSVFMWYEKDLQLPSSGTLQIKAPKSVALTAFVNGQMQSFAEDLSHDDESILTYSLSLNLPANQQFRLSLLSENMGNNNMMGQKSTGKFKGITGSVIFVDKDKKKIDLTNSGWRNRPALIGELLAVYTSSGAAKVKWSDNWQTKVPVTWYQSQFKAPSEYDPTASALLAADGLNKGFAYINGINIGRYYTILMNDKSGRNTQRFYHIPWDWLKLGEVNTITLVDVLGAPDISKVQLMTSSMVSSDSLSLSERKKITDSGILTCEL